MQDAMLKVLKNRKVSPKSEELEDIWQLVLAQMIADRNIDINYSPPYRALLFSSDDTGAGTIFHALYLFLEQ